MATRSDNMKKVNEGRRNKSSIKQKRVIELLEQGQASSLSQAARMAQFSPSTSKGTIYKIAAQEGTELNRYIKQRFTKEALDLDIQELEQDCKSDNDPAPPMQTTGIVTLAIIFLHKISS